MTFHELFKYVVIGLCVSLVAWNLYIFIQQFRGTPHTDQLTIELMGTQGLVPAILTTALLYFTEFDKNTSMR